MYKINVLKAIGEETRLNIILHLMKKDMHVLEIVNAVNKSQPNISLALKKLETADILERYRDKQRVYYKIKNKEFIKKLLVLIKNE